MMSKEKAHNNNSKVETKINQGKSVRNQSIPEQYLIAAY